MGSGYTAGGVLPRPPPRSRCPPTLGVMEGGQACGLEGEGAPGSRGATGDLPASATALVWNGGADFDVRKIPVVVPGGPEGDHTVVVAVDLATVCASDRHTVAGRREAPAPGILGHEAVGRVAWVGPGGREDTAGAALAVGDRVVWSVTRSCGRCDRCTSGRQAKCRDVAKVGHQPLDGPWPLSGTYATHVLLPPGIAVVQVPDEVGDPAAALASCAGATAVAVVDAAGDLAGETVVVRGLGALGLSSAVAARAAGAARVVGIDPSPRRRDVASGLRVVDEVAGECVSSPMGSDLRVILEVSGAPQSVASALGDAGVGGTVVLAGSVASLGAVDLDPESVVRRHLTVTGVHNYEPHHLASAVGLSATAAGGRLGALVAPAVGLGDLPGVLTGSGPPVIRAAVAPSPGS